jgi:Uma2 family endonuclease
LSGRNLQRSGRDREPPAGDLAISDVDPGPKLRMYASHGVPEYWIVDPATLTTVAHAEPSGERYMHTATSIDGAIESLTLPSLQISLAPRNESA